MERLNVGLELMAVGAFREQRAGDEGAERGRHPGPTHHHGDGHDDQQRGGRHRLLDARQRHEPEQGVEQEIAGEHHAGDRGQGLCRGEEVHPATVTERAGGEQRREGDERDRGHVLEQQHRERQAAVARLELAGLVEHLQGERRGGQCERKTDEQGCRPGMPDQGSDHAQHQRADGDLRTAEAKDARAHRPQPQRLQLEPDEKQQQHDAELGELQELLCLVVGERDACRIGPERDPCQQIAEHGADAEPARKHRRQRQCGQQGRQIGQRHVRHEKGSLSQSPRPTAGWCGGGVFFDTPRRE